MGGYHMSIEALQRRCERLFEKADALKEFIDENEDLDHPMTREFISKRRHMTALYSEAATISICLNTFQNVCYEPLGPLV